ncbi:outer membrane protein [Legionella oakridgensis]|uniref:outer membrane protein n=1 Tax=Legionella oakridgensis TaxID=29423 RepID=UPI0003DE1696|nr:outer membrane beta-barrel protein [Legionella oakridgensis]ETO92477.1 outer membrane protein [Legionella oakridgensis RV-2-2007]
MKYFPLFASLTLGVNSLFAGSPGSLDPNFNGFYVGLGTGITSLFIKDTFSSTFSDGISTGNDVHKSTNTAVLFSGHAGYGAMLQPHLYFGGKASVYYTPMESTEITGHALVTPTVVYDGLNKFTYSVQPIYNIDAVLGYEFFPHFLPFIEAGMSFANVKNCFKINSSRIAITGHESTLRYPLTLDKYKTGYNIGIGTSYLVQRNWIFSGELIYHHLGKNSTVLTNQFPGTAITETHSRTQTSQALSLLANISYLFTI